MSLRKGSLQDYYNSPEKCRIEPGVKPTCYQDQVEPRTLSALTCYANPEECRG
jgi:hypothetical protein